MTNLLGEISNGGCALLGVVCGEFLGNSSDFRGTSSDFSSGFLGLSGAEEKV